MSRTDPDTADPLHDQLRALALYWDRQSTSLDGPAIRGLAPETAGTAGERLGGRRGYLLAVAAVVVIAAAGGLVLDIADRSTSPDTGTGPAAQANDGDGSGTEPAPSASPSTTAPAPAEDEPSSETTIGFIPTPIPASELGWPRVRLLPPVASGFAVEAVWELLVEEEAAPDQEPAEGEQPRRERTEYLATDPDDRRAVVVLVTTYASPAEADEAMASPHPITPDTIDRGTSEVAGLPASYVRTWASAPRSGGESRHELLVTSVRLEENVVFSVAVPDGTLDQVAEIVSSASRDPGGRTVFDAQLAGFDGPIVSSDLSLDDIPGASSSDILGLALRHPTSSAVVSVEIHETDADGIDAATLTRQPDVIEGETGFGYVRRGLFGEQNLIWMRDGLVVTIDHYDRLLTDAELAEFADSLEPVDDATWLAAVDGITGHRSTSVALD